MGHCGAKARTNASASQSIQSGRRRLSVSQAAPIEPGSPKDVEQENRGTIVRKSTTDWKELLPRSKRRFSVFGAPPSEAQRGFDDKVREEGGEQENSNIHDIGIAYACKKGLKPESPNQDDFFILQIDDWGLYGVFDGHGPSGHNVSNFVHKHLPKLLFADPDFHTDPMSALKRSFTTVHANLQDAAQSEITGFDCALSGTTATVVLHRDDHLYIAHVGDSRAVGATTSANRLVAKNLTEDHKPINTEEKKRIIESGGDVRRLEGDIPHRVFVKGKLYPGLAMSRAIGDVVGGTVGVTAVPTMREIDLEDIKLDFFVIASDGVWEFIESQESVNMIGKFGKGKCVEAAERLASESWRRWVSEEENIVDDITVIIRWL